MHVFFSFKDLVLAKTLSYLVFYETYVFSFILVGLFILHTPILSPSSIGIVVLSSLLWFIALFLMKFIIMLIDSLVPIISNELERGLDRLFYFGSSLFYSTNLLSEKAKLIMDYNPLYQFSTILKSIFLGDEATIQTLFWKQCLVCVALFLIFLLFIVTNRFSLKKVRANQAFHLTSPY